MKKIYRYKFMCDGLKSDHSELSWKTGKWQTHQGKAVTEYLRHPSAHAAAHAEISLVAKIEKWLVKRIKKLERIK